MKQIIILILINLVSISVYAEINSIKSKINPLMKCLGEEEKRLYERKDQGPLYFLNKELIGLLLQFNEAQLKPTYFKEVCEEKNGSPSHELLRLLLTKQEKIFIIPDDGLNATEQGNRESFFMDLEQQTPQLFIKYLSMIQSAMTHPHCLETEISEIKEFLNKVKYLEGNVSFELIINENNAIDKIFAKLKHIKEISLKCKKQFQEEEQQKLKNKVIGKD